MQKHHTPQDLVARAQFRCGGPFGIECRIDGTVYDVAPFGSDAVQVREKESGYPVATLAFENGRFVIPGGD